MALQTRPSSLEPASLEPASIAPTGEAALLRDRFWPVGTSQMTLAESAIRVGQYHWLETMLFEITGRWVVDISDAETKIQLRMQSFNHSEHAAAWEARLLSLGEGSTGRLSVANSKGVLECFSTMGRTDGSMVERLVALYRVVIPRLIAVYSEHLSRLSPLCDAPLEGVLERAISGLSVHRIRGETLLFRLLSDETVLRSAAHYQSDLEAVITPGGICSGSR